MPNGVLEGAVPLQRAQASGGVSGQMDFLTQKFGRGVRLMGFGGRRPRFMEDVIDFYFKSLSRPLDSLASEFKSFYEFSKKARMEDKREKGGGLFKKLHGLAPHFFDFKVWKKITGTARKPEVAALHQIRDILIKVHELDQDVYGRDPRDIFTQVFHMFPLFRRKYAEGADEKAGIFKTIKSFTLDSFKERRKEDINFWKSQGLIGEKEKKRRMKSTENIQSIKDILFSENIVHVKMKGMETIGKDISDLTKTTEEQMHLDEKQADAAEFSMFRQKQEKKGTKSWLGSMIKKFWPFLAITGLLTAIWGKKGLIAGLAGTFFLKILPGLLMRGLRGAFNVFTRGFTNMGKFAVNLIKNPKAAMTMLKGAGTKIAAGAAKMGPIAGAVAGGAAFVGLTLHDLLKEGGGLAQMKKGKIAKGLATTAFGSEMKEATAKGVLKNVGKQAAKWGGLGATVGTFIAPGIGTAIGAGIGAAVGAIGSFIKAMWEKGYIQKLGRMLKQNWLGAIAGGAIGTLVSPGLGTLLGAVGGSWAQKKLRNPEFRKKMKDTITRSLQKVVAFTKIIWEKFKKVAAWAKTEIWGKLIKPNWIGGAIGGVIGTFISPGAGSILGALGGAYLQKRIRDPGFRKKVKEAFITVIKKLAQFGRWVGSQLKKVGTVIWGQIMSNRTGTVAGLMLSPLLFPLMGPAAPIFGMVGGIYLQKHLKKKGIEDKIKNIMNRVWKKISDVKNLIKARDWKGLLDTFGDIGAKILKWVADTGSMAWNKLKGLGTSAYRSFIGQFSDLPPDKQGKQLDSSIDKNTSAVNESNKLAKKEIRIREQEKLRIAALKLQELMANGVTELVQVMKQKKLSVQVDQGSKPKINKE